MRDQDDEHEDDCAGDRGRERGLHVTRVAWAHVVDRSAVRASDPEQVYDLFPPHADRTRGHVVSEVNGTKAGYRVQNARI